MKYSTCMIAPEKRPALMGDRRWRLTLPDPALTPKMVTRLGSPPNAVNGNQKERVHLFYFKEKCERLSYLNEVLGISSLGYKKKSLKDANPAIVLEVNCPFFRYLRRKHVEYDNGNFFVFSDILLCTWLWKLISFAKGKLARRNFADLKAGGEIPVSSSWSTPPPLMIRQENHMLIF